MKGLVRGQAIQQQQALGKKGDFAVHASVYGKSRLGPGPILDVNRGKKKERGLLSCPSQVVQLPI